MDDDLRSLREEDAEDEDLFGGFDEQPLAGEEDPFASLDELVDSDPFAGLEAPQEQAAFADADEFNESMPTRPAWADEQPLAGGETPEWLRELGVGAEEGERGGPADAPRPSRARGSALTALAGSGPRGMAFGMTAQQRMVLAIFLFLDVLVFSALILIAIGAINF